ncbi:MAG TPA: hypothetical protein PLR06_04320 [Cyclobacteriaceae bacterium]|nr:hypothetical protein [Cyclobacteriaceae bacterium]
MKARVGLVILLAMLVSCMNHSCPTYSSSKGHTTTASARKGKPAKKGATPYYKTLKVAEQD